MKDFYLRWILYPLFMFAVNHVPHFLDFAYLYIKNLNHEVHGKMMQVDYIEQVREALGK